MQEKYQIIPRKYRPQNFKSIVGQDAIVTTLKNALRFQRTAQAYLFCGGRGTGKTTLARLFAKALNCKNLSEDLEPCNACTSCQEISAGRSMDVMEIDGASNRGIDDIRQINETIGYAPASGKYKIYIIDEVHMLTKEAFNALLKTLEEPPAHVKFFFATTEPHKVLPTIISRCQRFEVNRISNEMIVKKLSYIAEDLKVEFQKDALALIAENAEGSLRDAESLLDQVLCHGPLNAKNVTAALGLTPRSVFFEMDRAVESKDLSYSFKLSETLFSSGKDVGYFVEELIEHFRRHLLLKMGPASLSHLNEQDLIQYKTLSSIYTEDQCVYILDFLIDSLQRLAKMPFKRVFLEAILLHVLRTPHRIPVETLVRRLTELEKALKSSPEKALESIISTPAPIPIAAAPIPVVAELPKTAPISPTPIAPSQDISVKEKVVLETPIVAVEPPKTAPISPTPIAPSQDNSVKEKVILETPIVAVEPPKMAPIVPTPEAPSQEISLEEKLILAIKQKIDTASAQVKPVVIEEKKEEKKPAPTSAAHPGKYDTLMRFAAIELEGIIKN